MESKIKHVGVTIQGVSPLMVDKFPDIDPSDGPKSAVRGDEGSPREQAEKRLYVDKGAVFIPGPNIFSMLISAGQFQKVGRAKLTTRDSSIVPGGVAVLEVVCPIVPGDWEVDSRRVVNQATKGGRICHRPRFDKWEVSFTLEIDLAEFDERVVRRLVDDAGRKIGLGVFRPARKGPFGRFVVTRWEEIERS